MTAQPPQRPGDRPGGNRAGWVWVTVAAVVALLVAVVLAAFLLGDDGDGEGDGQAGAGGASITGGSAVATATTVPSAAGPSTVTAARPTSPADAATAVWPVASSTVRYGDPVAAAGGFATAFVGFQAPVVGQFMAGDGRSGEVEVRPRASGPVTTVFVRQLEDGSWWVLGAAGSTIRLDSPSAGDLIGSPVRLTGAAHTFEGHVTVTIREDGVPAAVGTGFVTGAGDRMGPFDGEVAFARTPSQRYGAVVLTEESAENGQVWQASVVRIRLTG